jgi:L-arginine dehydrogenase
LREWSTIRVSSPALGTGDPARTAAVRALPFPVEIAGSVAAAVDGADVVCLCTSAAAPVVSLADCRDDVLVTSVSTNAPGAHEVAPDDIARCAVYVDYRTGAPVSASELRSLLEHHPGLVVADLPELVAGTAPPRPGGPAFFRSVGLGIEDIAIAGLFLNAAR